MCDRCWREAGSPTERTDSTARVVELIRQLYKIHATGGPLHVYLDDWHVDIDTITPSYEHYIDAELDALYCDGWPIAELDPQAPAVVEGLGASVRMLCDEIAALLNAMTETQRYAALAYAQGMIE